MRELNYQLKQLCRRNRDGSYRTQADRERQLTLIANQLHALGYRKMNAQSLKPKHVEALVKHWQGEELSTGAIKNRLSVIRWWAQKVDRQNVVARSNDHYGIPERQFVTNVSKARTLTAPDLEPVRDAHVRMSLELQQAFGLRREEAIKFQPRYADRGDHLELKASWTKGGKARVIPVRTEAQRAVLDRARQLVGNGSLIPSSRNYRQQLRIYETAYRQCRTLPDARPAPCLCAKPLRGADRLAGARGRRSDREGVDAGAKGHRPAGASHDQPGAGS